VRINIKVKREMSNLKFEIKTNKVKISVKKGKGRRSERDISCLLLNKSDLITREYQIFKNSLKQNSKFWK
jgi:hypothetical protein